MPIEAAKPGDGRSLQFWHVVPEAFSTSQCDQLIDLFNHLDAADGGLVAGRYEQKIRQSSLVWLPEIPEHAWVETRIAKLIADANRHVFGFALDGFDEQLQLAAYGPDHYYDWHIDRGQGTLAARRKLSISVQLSHPEHYVGGALEINADGHPFAAPRSQGCAVVFASTTLHRVTPVVSGLRHSLVAWTHGPDFV